MITLGRSPRLNHRHTLMIVTAGHLGRPRGRWAEKPRLVALPLPPSPAREAVIGGPKRVKSGTLRLGNSKRGFAGLLSLCCL